MTKTKTMWTQAEGLAFLVDLESRAAQAGLHVALAGSVLYRGFSEKDLDVIVYPTKVEEEWRLSAKSFIYDFVGSYSDTKIYDKHMCVVTVKSGPYAGRRIDFFLLC